MLVGDAGAVPGRFERPERFVADLNRLRDPLGHDQFGPPSFPGAVAVRHRRVACQSGKTVGAVERDRDVEGEIVESPEAPRGLRTGPILCGCAQRAEHGVEVGDGFRM